MRSATKPKSSARAPRRHRARAVHTGLVVDIDIAAQLSEIEVMLLMFGVGLHFSLRDLLAVKRIALSGAAVQMSVATLLGIVMAASWGGASAPASYSACRCRARVPRCC